MKDSYCEVDFCLIEVHLGSHLLCLFHQTVFLQPFKITFCIFSEILFTKCAPNKGYKYVTVAQWGRVFVRTIDRN